MHDTAKKLLFLLAATPMGMGSCYTGSSGGVATGDETTGGDGDGDPTTGEGDGDGDGDPTTGDGDGDPATEDGDSTTGDGDPTTGDDSSGGDEVPALAGAFFTVEDLDRWRARAADGPFVVEGDAFANSPDDWERMTDDAQTFLDGDTDYEWNGPSAPIHSLVDGAIFNSYEAVEAATKPVVRMMTAAFVGLAQDTEIYEASVKEVMLRQAQNPGTDFSDRDIFGTDFPPGTSTDSAWSFSEYQMKFLYAYDYLGKESFTPDEQQIMEKWFRDGAEWNLALVEDLDQLFVNERGIPIDQYEVKPSYLSPGALSHRDGHATVSASRWYNNRRLAMVDYIAHAGVMLDDEAMKADAANVVKEYLAFHWYPDRTYAELHRSTTDRPSAGPDYGTTTLMHMVWVARVLHLDGYENLFEYSTTRYVDDDQVVTNGEVAKSLEWAVLSFRETFMESDSPLLYPKGSSGTSTDIVMHFCLSTNYSLRDRISYAIGASIANQYYDNPEIRAMYWPSAGPLCGFPANPTGSGAHVAWNGPGGMHPGWAFAYAE